MKITTFAGMISVLLLPMLLIGCNDKEKKTPVVANADTTPAAVIEDEQKTDIQPEAPAVEVVENYDAHPGKALHDANCISCHDTGVYTREDRKIGDFPKLLAQVKRCDANLGSRLFDEEIEQVADYLNKAHYKYEKQ
ncbi:MAG: c-type cytochrome [Thiolinea sp.]